MLNIEKFENTYIITLEPYAKKISFEKIFKDLKEIGVDVEIVYELSREGEVVLKTDIEDINYISKIMRTINYICHILKLKYVVRYEDFDNVVDMLKRLCMDTLREVLDRYRCRNFRVVCKRIYKKFPITSVELCRIVGIELSKICEVNLENPECYIYIEVRRGIILVGYSTNVSYVKIREVIPHNILNYVEVIVLEPLTIYEYMDLIQLARAINVKLKILDKSGRSINMIYEACNKLGIDKPENVDVCYLEDCFKDVDYIVVLSQYAIHGESVLQELSYNIISRGRRLCLVLGNEIEDVPIEIRDFAHCEIRLGPMTGHAMRSTTAIAYALGVILSKFSKRLTQWL